MIDLVSFCVLTAFKALIITVLFYVCFYVILVLYKCWKCDRRRKEQTQRTHNVMVKQEKRNMLGTQIKNSDDYSDMFDPF